MILYKKVLFCILIFTIGGCVKYVDVPVWVCPSPNIPKREELKTKKLDQTADTDTILRSLIYDLTSTDLYAKQLETLLRGYQRESVPVFKDGKVQK